MPGDGKEYGLILPNKKKEISKPSTRTLNPLATSDDELEKEEGESLNWVEASLKKSAGNSGQQSLQKRLLREALEEDATVFQYDEVYDDLKASQQEEKERKTRQLEKKPKYIETILKHTEKRKLENERRLERKVQKERETEGNEFADKESFVTPSYLKKLEELKKAEEADEREKLIEEKIDVHKHKNFGVFYNHLLKQRVGEKEIKQEPEDKEVPGSSSEVNTQKNSQTKQKNYRTQNDLSDEEPIQNDRVNIDIKKEVVTSSSSEDENPSNVEKKKKGIENKTQNSRENNNNLFRPNSGNRDRSNIRRRSSSRDRVDNKYKKKESDDRRSRDKRDKGDRIGRDRSRDRHTRHRSRSADRRERSRDKRRERTSSREKDRRDKSKNGNRQRSKDRSGLDRSRDKNRKDFSRSRSRERTSDKKEREKRSKRSRSRDTHEKPDQKKGKTSENHSKETDQKIKKENLNSENGEIHSGNKPPIKQSINATLGVTDVNKMKIEDRIKRFTEIFAKRTVNNIYDGAVHRYFQRKAERGSSRLV